MSTFFSKYKESDCQGCTHKDKCGKVDIILCILKKINAIERQRDNEQETL